MSLERHLLVAEAKQHIYRDPNCKKYEIMTRYKSCQPGCQQNNNRCCICNNIKLHTSTIIATTFHEIYQYLAPLFCVRQVYHWFKLTLILSLSLFHNRCMCVVLQRDIHLFSFTLDWGDFSLGTFLKGAALTEGWAETPTIHWLSCGLAGQCSSLYDIWKKKKNMK